MQEREHTVVIFGKGGREDALAWYFRRQPEVGQIIVAPGNGGTERFPDTKRMRVDLGQPLDMLMLARDVHADLVVFGSEEQLAMGVVNYCQGANIPAFGPRRESAIETSKVDQVFFNERHKISQPWSAVFNAYPPAAQFLANPPWVSDSYNAVVKADGLCGGKGVFVCDDYDAAQEALARIMVKGEFGSAGRRVVIQEKLEGFEISATAIVRDEHMWVLPFSEDHKQLFDGDCGPNTGGMGVVAPYPLLTRDAEETIIYDLLLAAIHGLYEEGRPFHGCLYPGIMMTANGPKVLEWNVRFGDPEAEAILPLVIDRPELRYSVFARSAGYYRKRRQQRFYTFQRMASSYRHCIVVTLAAGGYPGKAEGGAVILGLDDIASDDAFVFHAGTERGHDGTIQTNGGRVAMVGGLGETLDQARQRAYAAIDRVSFYGKHYRTDIGARTRH